MQVDSRAGGGEVGSADLLDLFRRAGPDALPRFGELLRADIIRAADQEAGARLHQPFTEDVGD